MNNYYLLIGLGLIVASAVGLVLVFTRHIKPHMSQDQVKSNEAAPLGVLSQSIQHEEEVRLRQEYDRQIAEESQRFGSALKVTSDRLTEEAYNLSDSVIKDELDSYRTTLESIATNTNKKMEEFYGTIDKQREELQKSMQESIEAEKTKMLAQLDTRLGDIVSSYISEALGGGVDLGSQMEYITQTLESNKEELKKDLTRGN
jgi:hypothetical protein